MTPVEASREENENKVWINLYPEFDGVTLNLKFSIGDNVRITKTKNCFRGNILKGGVKKCLEFIRFN